MSTIETPIDVLQSIHDALQGITPLPWEADRYNLFLRAGKKRMVADDGDRAEGVVARIRGAGGCEPQERNLHAIATVMNAAPDLLSRLEAAEKRAKEAERRLGVIQDHYRSLESLNFDITHELEAAKERIAELESRELTEEGARDAAVDILNAREGDDITGIILSARGRR